MELAAVRLGDRGSGRLSLTPSVEVGLRHDARDAETGSGLDLGGSFVMAPPATGLAVDVRVRMLLVHEAEGLRDRGVSVSLSYKSSLTIKRSPRWRTLVSSSSRRRFPSFRHHSPPPTSASNRS